MPRERRLQVLEVAGPTLLEQGVRALGAMKETVRHSQQRYALRSCQRLPQRLCQLQHHDASPLWAWASKQPRSGTPGFLPEQNGTHGGGPEAARTPDVTRPGRAEGPGGKSSLAAPAPRGETLPRTAPRRPAATPPPLPHTYSVRGSAPLASRLHSSSRSLSAAETVSPPLPPLPFRR